MSSLKLHGRQKKIEQPEECPLHFLFLAPDYKLYCGFEAFLLPDSMASFAARRSCILSIVDVSSMIMRTWSTNIMAQNRVKIAQRMRTITDMMVVPKSKVTQSVSLEQVTAATITRTNVQPAVIVV